MAIAFVAHRGSASTKVSGTTLAVSPTANLAVGTLIFVRCTTTNNAAVDGDDTAEHSISDSKGNAWTKVKEFTAGGGVVNQQQTSLFMSKLTVAILTTDTITLTTVVAEAERVIAVEECSVGSGAPQVDGAVASTVQVTTPTITLSGLANVSHFFFGLLGVSTTTAESVTQDADYANGTQEGTSGGVANSNRKNFMGTRVLTATSDTYNPTLGTARRVIIILAAISATDTTVVDVTKGGTYRVNLTAGVTKGGTYRIPVVDQQVQKSGTYRARIADQDVDMLGIYRVLNADFDISKSSQYSIQPFTDVLKSAIYRILRTFDVTKLGAYRILIANQDVMKAGTYRIVVVQDTVKLGGYRVVQVFDIVKTGVYRVQPTFDVLKAGMYRLVGQTPEILVAGTYRVIVADQDITKSGVYRVKLVVDTTKGGEYRVIIVNQEVAKTGEYRLLMAANDVLKTAIYRITQTLDVTKGGEYRAVITDNDLIFIGVARVRRPMTEARFGRYVMVPEPIERVRLTLPLDEEEHASGDVETLRLTLSLQEA